MMSALPENLETLIERAAPAGVRLVRTVTAKGVVSLWCELASKSDLPDVARRIKDLDGRLLTISVFQPKPPEDEDEDEDDEAEGEDGEQGDKAPPSALGGVPIDGSSYELAYHFDLDGATLTVQVFLPAGAAEVASLTPLFRNADWCERDFMENFSIRVEGHPDPRRLFLDPSIEPAALERLIPFSTLVNAASTKALWEKIISHQGGKAS